MSASEPESEPGSVPVAGPSVAATLRAVRTLIGPLEFEPAEPSLADVPYREASAGRGIAAHADIYLPEDGDGGDDGEGDEGDEGDDGDGDEGDDASAVGRPSVLLVHGGGFVLGSRRMRAMRLLATWLRDAGYVVAAADYRMIFRGGRIDEMLDDVVTFIRWWKGQHERFNLDGDRVALCGLSAGATLSLLATEQLEPGDVRMMVSVFGLYDFAGPGVPAALLRRLLLGSKDQETASQWSPMQRECAASLPLVLLHGDADDLVPYEQAERFLARRRGRGGSAELFTYPGQPHAFFNDARAEIAETAFADLLSGLQRHGC